MSEATLLVREEALKLIKTSEFVQNWKHLAVITPGFTLLQEPEYVLTWYQIYASEYDPVVAVFFGKENELLGLMCLAWQRNEQVLTHVGHDSAEYHGWLAVPEANTKFVHRTIELVRERFDLKSWTWRWLPPGMLETPFLQLSSINTFASIEHRPSLIWNLKDPEKLRKLKKSRSLKTKFNRYHKRGNLQFKVASADEEISKILEVVKHQSDFRHEAVNNALPFADNPNKVAFNLALQKYPEINHMSGLWLDDKILAYHLGICDGNRFVWAP